MKLTRYTKFTGDLSTSFDLEDLLESLSDFLLDSGFQDPFSPWSTDGEQTMDDLRDAIRQALDSGELLDEDHQQQYDDLPEDGKEELVDKIVQRMKDEAYLNAEDPASGQGQAGAGEAEDARFEITDKGLDFLGYKALRELLGPL